MTTFEIASLSMHAANLAIWGAVLALVIRRNRAGS